LSAELKLDSSSSSKSGVLTMPRLAQAALQQLQLRQMLQLRQGSPRM
jgi:hypothetical protein